MKIEIIGTYNGETEVVDTFYPEDHDGSPEQAGGETFRQYTTRMLEKYRTAFGPEWSLRKKASPGS